MHNSSYSRATLGLETKKIHKAKKGKGKGCGYYMRIVFFFSSLIQSLIIASLVLFLVYGQPEKTAEEKRVEDLELAFNKLSTDNTQLRKDKADLTGALKAKTGEKDAADKEIAKLKNDLNLTTIKSSNLQKSLVSPLFACMLSPSFTHPHVVSNWYDLLSSVEQTKIYFFKYLVVAQTTVSHTGLQ